MAFIGNPKSVARGVATRTWYGVFGNRLTQGTWLETWEQSCDSKMDLLSVSGATWVLLDQRVEEAGAKYYNAVSTYERKGPWVNQGFDATDTAPV